MCMQAFKSLAPYPDEALGRVVSERESQRGVMQVYDFKADKFVEVSLPGWIRLCLRSSEGGRRARFGRP